MKQLKMIYSLRPLFPSYDRFTRFSNCYKVFRKVSNEVFSPSKFCLYIDLSPNGCFLLEIIKSKKTSRTLSIIRKKLIYPGKFITSWRKHPFRLNFVAHSSVDKIYLWTKFRVGNMSFEILRNTLQQVKNRVKRS